MSRLPPSRSAKRARPARAPFVLKFAAACLQAIAITAFADPHEASRFSVPSGSPDETMQAAAAFALELQPDAEISFRDSQSGSLSVSRVEDDRIHCILRLSPDTAEALMPLNRFLNGRLDRDAQAMWALAHEIGHCKLRDAFLNRTDGHVADASVFPWLAQEAAADAYGILSVERKLGNKTTVREAVILSRMLAAAMYHDRSHATGHYVSDALALCPNNRNDADAVQCAISTAYYTVGSIANDQEGAPMPVDSPPQLIYETGVAKIASVMHVYENMAQYKAQFTGADLSRFEFNEVSHNGESHYITAESESGQKMDMTYRLADFYGFKTGELVTDDERNVKVMRIDGADELDWLLTLGAVVRTQDGESLRKGEAQR
ncbi:MAG: hypothetical protein JO133_06745 [Burkholderiaceae bacterium]|nr:hypothetical protein [Burkholderiaceae bacterium]